MSPRFLVCTILFLAFLQPAMAQYAGEMRLYRNKVEGIAVRIPAQWNLRDELDAPAILLVQSPSENFNNDFREEIEIRKMESPDGKLLTFNTWISQLQHSNVTFKEVVRGRGLIGPDGADWIVYTMHHWGYDVKCMAYYFARDEKCYLLVCTSVESAYEKYEKIFRETAASFRIR